MRELAVFYCPDCGHYAYYQTSRHPVCPKCGDGRTAMCMLKMYYTEFMNMTCEERDNYLSMEMLKRNPSIMARITEPHKRFNSRETIAELCNVIMDLDAENKILSDTVSWMHDTIWDMLRAQKGLDHKSKERAATDGIEAKAPAKAEGGADTVEVGIEKAGPGLEAAATQELPGPRNEH